MQISEKSQPLSPSFDAENFPSMSERSGMPGAGIGRSCFVSNCVCLYVFLVCFLFMFLGLLVFFCVICWFAFVCGGVRLFCFRWSSFCSSGVPHRRRVDPHVS